jgi:hypothetical protein
MSLLFCATKSIRTWAATSTIFWGIGGPSCKAPQNDTRMLNVPATECCPGRKSRAKAAGSCSMFPHWDPATCRLQVTAVRGRPVCLGPGGWRSPVALKSRPLKIGECRNQRPARKPDSTQRGFIPNRHLLLRFSRVFAKLNQLRDHCFLWVREGQSDMLRLATLSPAAGSTLRII